MTRYVLVSTGARTAMNGGGPVDEGLPRDVLSRVLESRADRDTKSLAKKRLNL